MLETLVAIAMLVAPVASSRAADDSAVVAVVRQFMESLNKGDAKGVVATCADRTSIIDEFPPHEWHGTGACAKWLSDAGADEKTNQVSDAVVTLGKPWHVDVTGDRAYVVVPADYEFKQKGKPVKETGSILTMALQKGATGWRIIGWSWAKH